MNRLIAFAWDVSAGLGWIALGASLFGIIVVGAAVIRYLREHRIDMSQAGDGALPREIWRGREARAGIKIFAAGIAMLVADLVLRLSLPAHHF